MPTPIEIHELRKVYGTRKQQVIAVQGLSFTVAAGQVYGFLGPNGAGKSTTIRMILGLTPPTSGQVKLFGQALERAQHILHQQIGSLVDGGTFYPFMTGHDNLRVLARTSGCEDTATIERLLTLVGLEKAAERKVKGYSTGMKQRLGIAAALLNDPDLVILDEPTNGLDPQGIREVRTLIRRLVDEFGKTVLLSSHLLYEVEQLCDRVAIIHQGRMLQQGKVSELLASQSELCLDVDDPEQALHLLQQANFATERDGHSLRVQVTREETPALIQHLVQNEIAVYAVSPQRRTLESYFLEVTNHA